MKKLILLIPFLPVVTMLCLTSCTVVEPVPATSTTTHTQETVTHAAAPGASTTTTTTRASGGY